jgi:hypothetical protein
VSLSNMFGEILNMGRMGSGLVAAFAGPSLRGTGASRPSASDMLARSWRR